MIASIDSNFCTGCEECVISCPEVFEINLSTYLANVKEPQVPENLHASVGSLAKSCPVGAINLTV
ncbi:ferredoxin [Kiritimatiellota bacterium B12222]|nr:ferredoxin [Kiritimatiellota bacterium B12222]